MMQTTTKAELTDGSIITLDGPCEVGCITHAGPHWLHMDEYERWANQQMIHNSMTEAATNRYAVFEARRLAEKRRHMQNAGIVRLIQDGNE